MTVRELIESRGIKKVAVAKAIGIRASALSKYLYDWEPLPRRCVQPLAVLLGLSVEEIERNQVGGLRAEAV